MDCYIERYRKRYTNAPMFVNMSASVTILKDLIRAGGLETTMKLITQYLRDNGDKDWYVRNGHSLEVLKGSISAVNAALGSCSPQGGTSPLTIAVILTCDCCKHIYDWIGHPAQLDSDTRLCPECQKSGGRRESGDPTKQSRPLEK